MEHGYVDYDKSSANSKRAIKIFLLFIVTLGVIMISVFYLAKTAKDHTMISNINHLGLPYEVEEIREYEDSILNKYGVIDADKGIYRIPIQKAMDKVIKDYR